MPCNFLKYVFVLLVARPVMLAWLSMNVRNRERLPRRGPAIVAANHNSHLDTLALLALFPLASIASVRPVAAADYFMRSRAIAWFSRCVLGIVPVKRERHARGSDPLDACHAALNRGEILLIFPEGTRGEPERMAALKCGIARLAERHPAVPVITVFMHGLGKAMPKGACLPAPVAADIFLGPPFRWTGSRQTFMATLRERFDRLRAEFSAPGRLQTLDAGESGDVITDSHV
jgi:1-acyl-sn-glycerol-3-phosphate acyltransferase